MNVLHLKYKSLGVIPIVSTDLMKTSQVSVPLVSLKLFQKNLLSFKEIQTEHWLHTLNRHLDIALCKQNGKSLFSTLMLM